MIANIFLPTAKEKENIGSYCDQFKNRHKIISTLIGPHFWSKPGFKTQWHKCQKPITQAF